MAARMSTPLVGRLREQEEFGRRLDDVTGSGAVMLLAAEPGIGKSRTLTEFVRIAQGRGLIIAQGSCLEGDWQAAYAPFKEALEDYAASASAELLENVLGADAAILSGLVGGVGEPVSGATVARAVGCRSGAAALVRRGSSPARPVSSHRSAAGGAGRSALGGSRLAGIGSAGRPTYAQAPASAGRHLPPIRSPG